MNKKDIDKAMSAASAGLKSHEETIPRMMGLTERPGPCPMPDGNSDPANDALDHVEMMQRQQQRAQARARALPHTITLAT